MRRQALRCRVCGGPAFDCKCWAASLSAEHAKNRVESAEAVLAALADPTVRREVARVLVGNAEAMLNAELSTLNELIAGSGAPADESLSRTVEMF